MRAKTKRKLLSLWTAFSLLFQSLSPALVYASELVDETTEPVAEETVETSETSETTEPTESSEPVVESGKEEALLDTFIEEVLVEEEAVIGEEVTDETVGEEEPVAEETAVEDEPVVLATVATDEETVIEEPITNDEDPLNLDAETQVYDSSATVTTDQADYSPTGTVLITASDLQANSTYILIVRSNDPPEVYFETEVTTDDTGSFAYSYQLDGIYRPNYIIEIKDGSGTIVISTSFTDSPSLKIDQCKNGGAGSSVNCDFEGSNTGWGSGNANQANAHLVEGQSQAYRLIGAEVPVGSGHTIVYSFDYTKGGKIAQDFSTHYANMGSTVVDPTAGTSFAGAPDSSVPFPLMTVANGIPVGIAATTAMTKTLAVQTAFYAANPSLDDLSMWGGTITGVSYSFSGSVANVNTGDTSVQVHITFDKAVEGDLLISMGGHISRIADYAPSPETAIFIPGSPYHHNLISASFTNTGNQDVQLAANAVTPEGDIVIRKVTDPDSDTITDFSFEGDLSGFTLTGNGDAVSFSGLDLGSYQVSELDTSGWDLTDITCEGDLDGGSVVDLASGNVTIDLDDNELITCTFTNTRRGTITLEKDVVPNDDSTWDFLLQGPNFWGAHPVLSDEDPLTFLDREPGTYTITETTQDGYYISDISCGDTSFTRVADDQIQFELLPGADVSCTFTNTKLGSITVEKITNPSDSQDTFDFDLGGDDTGFAALGHGESYTFEGLLAGNYSVTEDLPAGWYLTALCDDQTYTNGSVFELATGENVTCTFTNTKLGTIIVEKQTDPDQAVGDFTFTGDVGGTVSDGGQLTLPNLLPGTYTSTENDPTPGFDLTNIACDDSNSTGNIDTRTATFNLDAGETVTCTFTNTQRGSISGYKYEDEDGSLLTEGDRLGLIDWTIELWTCASDFTGCIFSLSRDTEADGSYTFTNLVNGYYQIKEVLKTGWTNLTSLFINVSLEAGEDSEDNNFFNFENISVTACKVVDGDGDLQTTDDQSPHTNWPVRLLVDGQVSDSQLTQAVVINDEDRACYTWANLGPGHAYGVQEDVLNGWIALTPTTYDFGLPVSGSSYEYTFANFEKATIIVHKNVLGTDGVTDVSDTTSFTALLDGGNGKVVSETTDATYLNLSPGTYVVSEDTPPSGYEFISVTDDEISTADGTITVLSGGTYNVYLVNKQVYAALTVIKHVINDNGGTAVAGNFTMNVTGTNVSNPSFPGDENGTLVYLDAGSYNVDENFYPGYEKSFSEDCSGTIAFGDTGKTCTITNDDVAPSLRLVKEVRNNGGGKAVAGDWTLNARTLCAFGDTDPACGFSDSGDSAIFHDLEAGRVYNLFESGPSGYEAGDWVCDGGSLNGNKLTLGLDDEVTCTITNDDVAPTLRLVKHVINDDGGTAAASDWILNARTLCAFGDTDPACGFSDSGDSVVFHTLAAGKVYRLFESGPDGYEASNWSCDGGSLSGNNLTLGLDEDVICEITNDDLPGYIKIVKNTIGGDGEFDFNIVGPTPSSPSVVTSGNTGDTGKIQVDAGDYSVDEIVPAGWDLTDSHCDSGEPGGFTVENDKTVTCTFEDTQRGKIVVTKDAISDSDQEFSFDNNFGDSNPSTFILVDDSTPGIASQEFEVLPGSGYWVSEDTPSGWKLDSAVCDGDNTPQDITIDPGETVNCDFVNKKLATIILEKVTIGGDGTFDFDMTGDTLPASTQLVTSSNYDSETFYDIDPDNTYTISEVAQAGWDLTNSECTGTNTPDDITPNTGEVITCTFTNVERGSITVYKTTDPEVSRQLFDFDLGGDATDSAQVAGGGSNTFENLLPGDYSLTEIVPEGWDLDYAYCGEREPYTNGDQLQLDPGEEIECTFHNIQRGEIFVVKYFDENGNGQRDEGEELLPDWEINLSGDEFDESKTTDGSGRTSFTNLIQGVYVLSETLKQGWELTNIACDRERQGEFVQGLDNDNSYDVNVYPGVLTYCEVGNISNPELTISKSVNTSSTSRGGNVTFTIVVTLTGGSLGNVTVTDVPADGFSYRAGSWTSDSSVRGDISGLGEPTYASPGVWQLGDMVADEIVTLTYIADVASDIEPGIYPDLAWAKGLTWKEEDLLALAVDPGYVDTNFVGTRVGIDVPVEVKSEFEGEVLGASTELPATGANQGWLVLAGLMIMSGIALVYYGRELEKKNA